MPVLRGRAVWGMGNISPWMEKLQDHCRCNTGMTLFSGTLNVEIETSDK